ncbi:MAG: glycoside hydrolase family 3 C-terminal domain-containing protein, partial [Bacteriovoracaceae bacterium]
MKNYISHSRILIVIILISFQQRSLAQILTIEDRITTLLSQMTMEEKIAQLHQAGSFNTADNERLKIPGFIMADGPHGVRDGRATSFPVGIGMAAMWDRDVAYRIGVAMGKEFRGKGKHQALGPALDLDRDPRNGRSAETGGEDPYLTAQTTTAVTKGIQSTPTIATIKHFNVNHRENGRMTNNIIASKRMLTETNGLTFRTAVQEGGAFCVMNAYNLINGEKCAENSYLLTTILRDYWGFPFYVVSDWGSIWDTKKAITAGCDIEMGSNLYSVDLPYLVFNNLVSEETINRSVRRVLRTKLLTGMLDYQPEGDPADVNSIAHQQLCLEAARKSIVLLKNENSILPLSKNSISKLALIGPSAAITQLDGGGSAYVTPFYSVSPKQGIESKLSASNVVYARGCDISDYDTSAFGSARSAAASADVVVFVGGLDPSQESEGMDRIGGSINLPVIQQDLIKTLAQVNSKLIVVIYSGGICGVMNSIRAMKGLLYAFYPGQESGNALADILFGDVNPSGKLPVTMPLATGLLPTWGENINEGLGGGYRWFDDKSYPVQFAFGTGLSYTTFSYSNLVVNPVSAL